MAYLQCWRESVQRRATACRIFVRNHWADALGLIPTDCLLCQGSAKGGCLCAGCLHDVLETMYSPVSRCGTCRLALEGRHVCPDCTLQPPAFDRIIAAFDYRSPGDVLIRHLKAGRRFSHARPLAQMLAFAVRTALPALPRNTILVPVPSSRASIRQRGFNPAAEIAGSLAQQLQLALRPDLLVRSQEGARQKLSTRMQRIEQAAQLYACPKRVEQASIAVVDDVLTTGSTMHGIARAFKAAGAASVCGLVLARTLY